MTTFINHGKYYNSKDAIGKVKNFFKPQNGEPFHRPEKPGESEMIDIIFPETHFAVTFEPSRVVIESNIDTPPNDLIAYLEFLAAESIQLTKIFGHLETVSDDYRHIATIVSTPELSVVRFEKGETTAIMQRKTVGDKVKLLLDPIEGRPLDDGVKVLISTHFTDVEKMINI